MTIKAVPRCLSSSTSNPANGPTDEARKRVFNTPHFNTFVTRKVRLHLVSQFVDGKNQVLLAEIKGIGEVESVLRNHLLETVPAWGLTWRVSKMIVATHIRTMATDRLALHDVEEEIREEALARIFDEDFESLWPKEWQDVGLKAV